LENIVRQDLINLKLAANRACIKAVADKQNIDGAINWADLNCHTAEEYQDESGNTGKRVYVQEAAPDNGPLCIYISQRLHEMGFGDIEVVTEW
jgi:hypothetical protein